MSSIKLNDILKLETLNQVKVRFNLMFENNWNPMELFKNNQIKVLLDGQYWNYNKKKSFKLAQTTIGFIKIRKNDDLWLLFHVGKVTKDLGQLNGVGYEYKILHDFDKYFGRLIVRYKNTSQNMIRNAESVFDDCDVVQILPDIFDNDLFPGYDKVDISWHELSRVLNKSTWRTALENQKGVYLISDSLSGKIYVGSAYGDEMILNRWRCYVETCHGNNKELKRLQNDYIKDNFRFSILEIFKSTTDNNVIIGRENYWKEILMSRRFGYNIN